MSYAFSQTSELADAPDAIRATRVRSRCYAVICLSLLIDEERVSLSVLSRFLGTHENQLRRPLETLVRDGLIEHHRSIYWLSSERNDSPEQKSRAPSSSRPPL